MKITKLSLLALSFGLFAASCGDSTNEETTENDTMVVAPVEAAPMTTPDTMMAAPAMGADTMTSTTTTTTTTDTMKK